MNEFDLDRFVQKVDEQDPDILEIDVGDEEQPRMSPSSPQKKPIPSRVMGRDRLPGASAPAASTDHVAADWCNAIEAGKIAGKSPTWAYAAAARGDIVSKRYGGAQVFLKTSLGAKKSVSAPQPPAAPAPNPSTIPEPHFDEAQQASRAAVVLAIEHPAFAAIQTQLQLATTGRLAPAMALAAIAGIASHAAGR